MLSFVISDNLLMSFIFFELVGFCSWILIGFWFREDAPPKAATKAFLVTRFGDYFFLIGVVAVLVIFGTANFAGPNSFPVLAKSAILAGHNLHGLDPQLWVTIIGLLILGGVIGKSAQFPLHTWLPDAMEGPTPVSALIHAATMVAAGVFVTPDLGETILADTRLKNLYGGVQTADELRKVVQVNADRGVDFIKTRGTERAGLPQTDPRKQTYTESQLKIIVEEARKFNIPVMAHAHGDEGGYAAVKAGVKSIEHGTYLTERTLKLMKKMDTFLVPTFTTVVDLTQPGGDYDNPVLIIRGQHMLPSLENTVKMAYKMGIKIATGADTGYGPNSTTRVGMEITNFVNLGMKPLDAIQSATIIGAELLGVANKTGTISIGKEADLIVVTSNPFNDIRTIQDVVFVMSNGRIALNRLPFEINK